MMQPAGLDLVAAHTSRLARIGRGIRCGSPAPASGAAADSFTPRTLPFEDIAEYVRSKVLVGSAGGRHRVEVIIEASAATVSARVGGWADVRADTATRCTMIMETDELDGPLFVLGAVGADFTVVTPPELTSRATDWGRRFVEAG